MKFLFTADWHIGLNTDSYLIKGRGNSRLIEQENCLQQILKHALISKTKHIVVGGDIYETSSPSPASEEMLHRWIDKCRVAKVEVIFLMGNHDFNSSGKSALHPLQALNIQGVHVITSPRVLNNLLFLPHVQQSKWSEYVSEVEDLLRDNPKCKIAVAHNHTAGARTGFERRLLNNGENTFESYPEQIKTIFLGHIHKPQEYVLDNGQNCIYSGSLIKNDISENNDIKRFLVCDTEENTNAPIQVPLSVTDYWIQRVDEDEVENILFEEALGKISHIEIYKSTGKYNKEYFVERLPECQIKTIKFEKEEKTKKKENKYSALTNEQAINEYFKNEISNKLAKQIIGSI